MLITKHFNTSEYECKCCGNIKLDKRLFDMLEKLRVKAGKPIIITSGYRCPKHSVNVGGYANDAHTVGIAADITIDGYTPWEVAAMAEEIGFTGIGVMSGATHVDIRNSDNYSNSHWFGDERTGENVATFIKDKCETTVTINNKKYKITISEVN